MGKPNLRLKGLTIEKYETLTKGAREFWMDEFRLSRIIHGRAEAKRQEMRIISWKLQRAIKELFPKDGDSRGN